MKHYTFVAKTDGLLDVLESASYVVFTTARDDGYVTGYAQGSLIPRKIDMIYGYASAREMRQAIFDSGAGAVTEMGLLTTMGVCQSCDATVSRTWSPWYCDTCFTQLKM